jgi:hypothetical protein
MAQPDNGISEKLSEIEAGPITRPFAFVLMPFDKSFNDVYQIAIKDACENAGAYCERVDEQIFEDSILQRIYNQINKADIIIADMSGRNANVFYKLVLLMVYKNGLFLLPGMQKIFHST